MPAFLALCILFSLELPADATAGPPASAGPARNVQDRIGLYSPRVRRSTIMYLRLRLLELREAGLDRARAAIEHRLSIDDLLADPAPAARTVPARPADAKTRPAASEKANGRRRRTEAP